MLKDIIAMPAIDSVEEYTSKDGDKITVIKWKDTYVHSSNLGVATKIVHERMLLEEAMKNDKARK